MLKNYGEGTEKLLPRTRRVDPSKYIIEVPMISHIEHARTDVPEFVLHVICGQDSLCWEGQQSRGSTVVRYPSESPQSEAALNTEQQESPLA